MQTDMEVDRDKGEDEDEGSKPPVTRTIVQLEEMLQMDELLVRNAVSFWLSHRVLIEVGTDTYAVLETLPSAVPTTSTHASLDTTAQTPQPQPSHAQPPSAQPPPTQPPEDTISSLKSANAVLKSNKDMYQMFMVGMLTNGGAMDAGRVGMMMRMVVPGGFEFGDDEVAWLLGDLVEQGRVVASGGVFAVKR